MKPLRLAVIGGGHLGQIHLRLARENSGFRVVAVCDPQPLVQQRVIREFDLRAVSSWNKIAGDFDAAVIATPTSSHFEVASALIPLGVHLLVEKPLAATAAEAASIVELATRHGVVVQVGHVECFNPAVQQITAWAGQPRLVRAWRHSGFTGRSTDISVVQDLMIHDLDLACELIGSRPMDVQASGTTVIGPWPDIAEARIRFENGGVAVLSASRCDREACRRIQVFGPGGVVDADLNSRAVVVAELPADCAERCEELAPTDGTRAQWFRENLFTTLLPTRNVVVEAANAIALEQQDWLAAIRGGHAPRVPASRGLRAVQLAETINQQVSSSAWNGSGSNAPREALLPADTAARRKSA